jgi:ABC-type transport system involved in Fe-S cluster assembly fused permease/ATPase subunit
MVTDADLILVMDGGYLVDQGRHHELLGRNAAYRTLHAAGTTPATRPVLVTA